MKKIFITSVVFSMAFSAQAFSLSGVLNAVSNSSSSTKETNTEDTRNQELLKMQNDMLAKYKASKEDFVKAYATAMDGLGNKSLKTEAETTLNNLTAKAADANYIEAAEAVDKLIEKTSEISTEDIVKSSETSQKCRSSMEMFSNAMKGEVEVAKSALEIAKRAKELMSGASTLEKIRIARSFEPTIELAKNMSDDLSKSKNAVTEIYSTMKKSGFSLPTSLSEILK